MNRTAQKALRDRLPEATQAELRRVRRGRGLGPHAGAGHGQRRYGGPAAVLEQRAARRRSRDAMTVMARLFGGVR